MAFNFDSSVGTSTANSYLSVSEADDYFAGRLGTDLWDNLQTAGKQKVLVMATKRIDRERFGGQVSFYGVQALQWPRAAVVSRNYNADPGTAPSFEPTGFYYIDSNTIPPELKQATCEQAMFYLKQNDDDTTIVGDYDLETLSAYKIGPIDVSIKNNIKADRLPTVVKELIKAIGPNAWLGEQGLRFYA